MLNIVHNISLRIENVRIEQQREVRCQQETLKVGRTGRDCRAGVSNSKTQWAKILNWNKVAG